MIDLLFIRSSRPPGQNPAMKATTILVVFWPTETATLYLGDLQKSAPNVERTRNADRFAVPLTPLMSGTEARLYVSWKLDELNQNIESFLLQKPG